VTRRRKLHNVCTTGSYTC